MSDQLEIVIGIPTHRNWEPEFGMSMIYLVGTTQHILVPTLALATYIDTGRQEACNMALERKSHGVWLIDDDMEVPPTCLDRLVAHNREIVGCEYASRKPPYRALGKRVKDATVQPNGLIEMEILPDGCLFIKTSVLEQIAAYVGRKGKIFGTEWSEELQEYERQDVRFCRLARELGFKIWCDADLSIELSHIGRTKFRLPKERAARPDPNPEHSAPLPEPDLFTHAAEQIKAKLNGAVA